MKPFAFPLSDGQVRLRLVEKADLELIRNWRNRVDIRTSFFQSQMITAQQQLAWWERYSAAEDDWFYVIESLDPESGPRPAGAIALYHYDPAGRTAEYGRLMIGADWARGRGFARAASNMLVEYGFRHLGLETIHLGVLARNRAALRLYESLGFEPEGMASQPGAVRMVIARRAHPAQSAGEAASASRVMRDSWRQLVGPWQPERPAEPIVTLLLLAGRNEESRAMAALELLREQTRCDAEVLVMDDTESASLSAAIASATSADPRFVHLRFDTPCPRRAVRLNQGVFLARGRFVGILSPEHLKAGDFLARGVQAMDHPGADLIAWPGKGLLARWRVFLVAGLFDPHLAAEGCYAYDLSQRVAGAGLRCLDYGAWSEAPVMSEATHRHLAQERNSALQLATILDYAPDDQV